MVVERGWMYTKNMGNRPILAQKIVFRVAEAITTLIASKLNRDGKWKLKKHYNWPRAYCVLFLLMSRDFLDPVNLPKLLWSLLMYRQFLGLSSYRYFMDSLKVLRVLLNPLRYREYPQGSENIFHSFKVQGPLFIFVVFWPLLTSSDTCDMR